MKGIALVGKMRSGKDTIAQYGKENYGMIPFAFGDSLKRKFHEQYPHIPRHPKPVRGYQLYGQLMRYVKDESIWIDSCFEKIEYIREVAEGYNILKEDKPFIPIITDTRQQDEIDRCIEEGYLIIRINCPDNIRLKRIQKEHDKVTAEDLNFETETSIDKFKVDYELYNEGTLEDLYKQFDTIVDKHFNL